MAKYAAAFFRNSRSISADLSNSEDIISWVRNALRYFHQLSYVDALKIKTEMIAEVDDGFTVVFNEQSYWLPKINKLLN